MKTYKEKLEQWAEESLGHVARYNQHEKQYTRNMISGAVLFAYRMNFINDDEKNELIEQYTTP